MAGKAHRPAGSYNASPEVNSNNEATVMLLGKTGAGKSSLGNAILNLDGQDGFVVTHGHSSTGIYHAVVKEATVNGCGMRVVDTPGVMDTNCEREGNEERVLSGICDGVLRCPDGVDAFLIVMRIDARLALEDFHAIAKLETLFGPELWRHAILVFTRGDKVNNDAQMFQDKLAKSRTQRKTLDDLILKLKTDPILVDASSNREPDVVEGQMNRLKVAVDKLMRENRRKYTNEIFDVVRDALSNKRSTELEDNLRISDLQVKQLRETVAQLEKDNKKIREEDGRKTQVMTDVRKRLEDAEKRAREAEEKMRKMEDDVKRQAEDAARRICTVL